MGIRSERVEAVGAAGRTTWMPVVGLADETSTRSRLCGISLVRSSRRQPFTTERPGGDEPPQGGVGAPLGCIRRTDVSVNFGDSQRVESIGQMGGQNYLGAKLRRR